MLASDFRYICPRATEYFTVKLINGVRTKWGDSIFNGQYEYGYINNDGEPIVVFKEPSTYYNFVFWETQVRLADIETMKREVIDRLKPTHHQTQSSQDDSFTNDYTDDND